MLRASLALLLLGASAAVFAQNGRAISNGNATVCQDVADRAVADRPGDAVPTATDARRARATAVRSKYAAPTALTPPTSRGGGARTLELRCDVRGRVVGRRHIRHHGRRRNSRTGGSLSASYGL